MDARSSGGIGMISNCVTDFAFCRCDVPRQSAPVSPPPMMMTCLPVARICESQVIARVHLVLLRQKLHREVDALQLAARDVQIARLLGAARQQDRVELLAQVLDRHVDADVGVGDELHAFGRHLFHAAIDGPLLHLEIGDAVAKQAADAIPLLEQRDIVSGARQLLRGGQPAGPEPITATRLPVLISGGSGLIQPSSKACSTIDFSMFLMVTGGSLMPSTHAASHGAGQMRPVNSGKLLVACSCADRVFPAVAIDEIIPVRNDVVHRTAGVAERHAAIHAARALRLDVRLPETAGRSRSSR